MTPASEPIETLSADERTERRQAKVEGWQLFWRFFWSAGLILCTVGIATIVAHWTGPWG
jgi:hypothetical protein